MNISIFVSSFKYILNNHTLVVSLSKWIYEEFTDIHYTDNKLLRSFKKQDYEVTDSIIRFIHEPNILTKEVIYSFNFIDNPYNRIKLFADYGSKDDIISNFLLSKAAELGYIDIVKLLLEYDIDVNIFYTDYDYVYDYDYEEHTEIFEFLTNTHVCAILYACVNKQYEIIDVLLKVTNNDTKSETLCYMNRSKEGISMAKILLKHGADVNYRKAYPLWIACENNNTQIAKLFIDSGFDLELYGTEILFVAAELKRVEIIKYLLEKGVVPHNSVECYTRKEYLSEEVINLLLSVNPNLFLN